MLETGIMTQNGATDLHPHLPPLDVTTTDPERAHADSIEIRARPRIGEHGGAAGRHLGALGRPKTIAPPPVNDPLEPDSGPSTEAHYRETAGLISRGQFFVRPTCMTIWLDAVDRFLSGKCLTYGLGKQRPAMLLRSRLMESSRLQGYANPNT